MSTTLAALAVIFILFSFKLLRDSLFCAWLWQIKEYRIDRMVSHIKDNKSAMAKNSAFFLAVLLLLFLFFIFLQNYPLLFLFLVILCFTYAAFQIIKEIKNRSFKRPKPTLKIMLIFFLLTFVYFLIALCWFYSSFNITSNLYLLKTSLLLLFIIIINPLIISLIVLAIEPIFYFQKKKIIKKAYEKMKSFKKIKVIGITGSYGKTSTKEFLYSILSQKYKVVKTEGNNNTNIGVAYTVLNKVDDSYDYFICEMGAYKRGEIKEICDIVKPEIGILTGINEQHIDLFGSQENIIKTKFELIEALPENGLAVINRKFKVQSEKFKVTVQNLKFFSLDDAKNIKVYQNYTEFDYSTTPSPSLLKEGNAKCRCEEHQQRSNPEIMRGELNNGIATLPSVARNDSDSIIKFKLNLLGKHYIENILSAIITAECLGMNLDEIKSAVEKIKPTEYMMRKSDGPNNSVFIDDSYSANPDGVMAALDYLAEVYSGYKKIIIFPGIIELGTAAKDVHRKLYNRIGKVCDTAYILEIGYWKLDIGKLGKERIKTSPLDKGGLGGGRCKFIFEEDFGKVAKMLKNELDKNAVVLFESRGAGAVMNKLKV